MMNEQLKRDFIKATMQFKRLRTSFPGDKEFHMGESHLMRLILELKFRTGKDVYVSDLQNDMHISKPAISQLLNNLEKKNYIAREIAEADRRRISVTLTDEGMRIMEEQKQQIDEMIMKLIDRVGEEKIRQLIELLNLFFKAAEEVREELLENEEKKNEE